MGDRLDLSKLPRGHRMRTVCANGRPHAEFAYSGVERFEDRCAQVIVYDDTMGCGPHTLEFHDNDGWFTPKEHAAESVGGQEPADSTPIDIAHYGPDIAVQRGAYWPEGGTRD